MKKIFTLFVLCSLALTSCSKDNTTSVADQNAATPEPQDRRLDPTDPGNDPCSTTIDLYAGQFTYVGTVTATYDPAAGTLTVVYNADAGWSFDESHLWVGDCSDLPTNPPGMPIIGQFPYKGTHVSGTTSITYVVENASSFGCFSAHAVVSGPNNENETAWMEGILYQNNGSWAMYDSYDFSTCAI